MSGPSLTLTGRLPSSFRRVLRELTVQREDSERLIRSIVSPEKLQRGPQGKATLKRKKFNRPTNPNDKP